MNARKLILAALLVVAPACASSRGGVSVTGPVADGCAKSIEEKCANGSCPSFDEAAAQARKPEAEGSLYRYSIGTCGTARFIRMQEGMGMGTDYYGVDGKLIASTSVADAPVCGGHDFGLQVGAIPKCQEQVLESHDYSVPSGS